MSRNSNGSSGGFLGALASKPEALLLLAAGAALMLRSGGNETPAHKARAAGVSKRRTVQHDHDDNDDGTHFGERISAAADKAREYVSDIADRTVETASGYASSVTDSVTDYADRARRGVADGSGHVVETVQQTVQRVAREQPLSVALVGLAAGAAIAAAFPATAVEGRMFGPTKQKLADAVSHASEQLKTAGAKAGERLAEVAEERGLNRDGLKEAAGDVADAFSEGLSEDDGRSRRKSSSGSRT